MTRCYFICILCLGVLFSCQESASQKVWTEDDRTLLLEGLQKSQAELIEITRLLNEDQWHFKTDSVSWSIAEIVEHLGLQQDMHFREVYVISQQPVNGPYNLELKENDEKVLQYEFDPNKDIAGFYVRPMGRWLSRTAALDQFNQSREEIKKFVEITEADLRTHFSYRNSLQDPDYRRKRDLHQILLTTVSHTRRHNFQIKMIMEHPAFPE